MRLSKIKLAGFKSFVDPTTIPFPSDLVGIVGPNGCGKSNTIDAVRWVMGESSAKNLRGDSMTDVIFNGSAARKPVGTCSVELVFDNTATRPDETRLGGEYAQYNEISVKRQVSRDGQSTYFLNGTRCRRRDVTDVFLGTGLGPRSYAIIEQGTISRIIEARPEEMRGYLEEAAGISKYKERRRETERRIKGTRENLERLNDLREEVGKQLQKLERQARTAERYKDYKNQERQLKAEHIALKLRDLDRIVNDGERQIAEARNALEAVNTEHRALETGLEQSRIEQTESTDALNEVQGRFYSIGAEIARTEQSIQHSRDLHTRLTREFDSISASLAETEEHQDLDKAELEDLENFLLEQEPELEQSDASVEDTTDRLAEAEQALNKLRTEWEDFNRRSEEPARVAEVERSRSEQMERQIAAAQQREQRLQDERGRLDSTDLEEEIETLRIENEAAEQAHQERAEALQGVQEQINELRQGNAELSRGLDTTRSTLQQNQGRFSSLEALQQAALGKGKGAVNDWLQANALSDAQRLAEQLRPKAGWERALETVLSADLQAVCVDKVDQFAEAVMGLEKGNVTLFSTTAMSDGASNDQGPGERLSDQVQAPWSLEGLLAGIFLAEDLGQALIRRTELKAGQSIVTRDGLWLGPNWLRVSREEDAHAGVLERKREIAELQAAIEELELGLAEQEEALDEGREHLKDAERRRDEMQAEASQAHRTHSDLRARLSGKEARLEQIQARRRRLEEDLQEVLMDVTEHGEELAIARQRHSEAMADVEVLAEEREILTARMETARAQVDSVKAELRRLRDASHTLALEVQSKRTARDALKTSLQRMEQQLEQQIDRRDEIAEQLEAALEPVEEQAEGLESLLETRLEVEQQLAEARSRVEAVDARLREHDHQRSELERRSIEARERLQTMQLGQQESIVLQRTLDEQLKEDGFHAPTLWQNLPEEATEGEWQKKNEDVAGRIQRLGPINLAAIEEFKEQSERREYLDAQHDDLVEAMDVLETAIRKIDRETKARFKETYDKVNNRMREMFPRLFGGGEAFLELTGDDLLETGVTVMARPPGKRISTIHLMSGGEKALTAVALVFAIFELNPAPFCMLDEVDAPLDDANVGRFCRLVEEMSDRVQFIFISHNKAAIEMAKQLTGVTMREPGVSRLVAVDVDEAVEMANAG